MAQEQDGRDCFDGFFPYVHADFLCEDYSRSADFTITIALLRIFYLDLSLNTKLSLTVGKGELYYWFADGAFVKLLSRKGVPFS